MKFQRAYFTALKVFAFALALSVVSCSGDPKERTAEDALSALVNGNKNVSVFGHASVYNILNKADYKHIPKANVLINAQLDSWKRAFNLDGPIYFALEGPFKNDATPETVYGFMDVKDEDSLISVIHELNFDTEKSGDFTYFQDGDITCGVRNHLLIFISKGGNYDGKAELTKAFQATEGDLSEDKPQEIITTKKDIVVGVSLQRLFLSANTALNKLPKAKLDELTSLLNDGYIETDVNFENGQIAINSKNMFSDALKDRLWFNDNGSDISKKLGKGTPWMGVAANIDMKKLNQFMADFSPNGTQDLAEIMGPEMGMMMLFSGLDFAKSLTGQFGAVAVGNAKQEGGTFEFNAYLGLTKEGQKAKSMVDKLFGSSPKKNGAYVVDNMAISAKDDGIYIYSVNSMDKSTLKLPSCAKNFGKSTLSMFVNFNAMDVKSLDLPKESKFLELMESVSLESTRDGTTITLVAKDKSKNILDQMSDFYYNMFKDEIGALM